MPERRGRSPGGITADINDFSSPTIPAHLIPAELVSHARVIQPDPVREHDDRNNNGESRNNEHEHIRARGQRPGRPESGVAMNKSRMKFTGSPVTGVPA
jgi:hypothetical protein